LLLGSKPRADSLNESTPHAHRCRSISGGEHCNRARDERHLTGYGPRGVIPGGELDAPPGLDHRHAGTFHCSLCRHARLFQLPLAQLVHPSTRRSDAEPSSVLVVETQNCRQSQGHVGVWRQAPEDPESVPSNERHQDGDRDDREEEAGLPATQRLHRPDEESESHRYADNGGVHAKPGKREIATGRLLHD
jgi:hypothetical protein